jgi:acyl-CoA synthetase (AMP-forming)/AMP-acid ligase II
MPKGMLRSHGLLVAQHSALAPLLTAHGGEEVALVGFPVFVLAHLGLGITSVLPPPRGPQGAFDAAALAALAERTATTRLLLPPGACEALLTQALPQGIRDVITGGGPVFPDLLRNLAAALPQARIVSLYGSTEAEPIAHVATDAIGQADWARMAGGGGLLAGRPVPEATIRIEDDEILVAGPHTVPGYLDPAQDAATHPIIEGRRWHRTGDAGRFDDEGRLWLLGRHAARVAGLYPFCVEAAARGWPGVRRAALVPVADRAVLLVEGEASRVEAWKRAARALGPVEVVPMAQIPLDARHRSKVDYRALRRIFADAPPRAH